ncbi:uncharacterized protein PAC_10834 [Phialocephala subalpina]|uniref:Uncharacterized protein n=1 Tax=Phialocephala subalpina TaxID=576137 RepID=A0A1L7X7D7_9HELO|nr:uncharacterized protein PAC_10834 [Phialocephala subalpina]
MVIERQSVQVSNRTITCGSTFFGGCCQGTLDAMGYNDDCKVNLRNYLVKVTNNAYLGYNATVVATNVGGSTFGPQTRYSCITALNATQTSVDAYYALCCKSTPSRGRHS